jgi:RNA polymerase sigma factor (sigma-70 family)
MTEEMLGSGDPIIRRLQQAFGHEEPATELAAIIQRAARYQAGEPPGSDNAPALHHDLTAADLVAARRREPAAVTRVYTAYAPALYRFFMAAVGDRHQAEDLTGTAIVSAIEGLPGFRGPVDALGGWLFQIARHDLYDYRRRQARSRNEPLDDNLPEAAAAAGAVDPEVLGKESDTGKGLGGVQAVRDREGVEPRPMPPQLFRRLPDDTGDQAADAPPNRLSPREREILGLLANGWSNRRIAEQCFLSLNTVRTHVQNILVKLGMHSKLEAVAFALEQGWLPAAENSVELVMEQMEGRRVTAALQRLAPDQREVLLLHMAAGLTTPEVAEILGKTTGAVKALKHRGLASLARMLGLQSPDHTPDHPYPSPDPDLASQEKHQG